MGGGYKVGDKVRIKRNAREELAKTESVIYLPRNVTDIIARGWGLISWSNGISSPKVEEWLFPLTCLEPWFEDEIPQAKIDEAMATLTKAGKIKDGKVIV
jgi:hypothetical protein